MSQPASQTNEFFLGIEGEQKGPFSRDEIFTMLNQGEISVETPIWCVGMTDWTPIGLLDQFKKQETKETPQIKEVPRISVVSQRVEVEDVSDPEEKTLVSSVDVLDDSGEQQDEMSTSHHFKPVFSNSRLYAQELPNPKSNKQLLMIGGAIIALALVLWIVSFDSGNKQVSNKAEQLTPEQVRSLALSKLQVEFNKNPEGTVPSLLQMVKENPSDNPGLEALETLLSHYRRQQLFAEAGSVLMVAKKPVEALDYFLKDPPDYSQAERAYEEAYNQAKGDDRRKFILQQIDLLIGRLNNTDKAISRIKVLDKEFPGIPHPYQYYLKSTEDRIADIFSRLSFYYVETLDNYISSELAQIKLSGKPLLSITKTKENKYRIVASYKGPVNLRNDLVPNIFFVFWLDNEQWYIVDTNLTKERVRFAKEEQKRHEANAVSAIEILAGLESHFKTQFPGKGLHELVTPPKRLPIGSVE